MRKTVIDCSKCEDYHERAAIIEHEGNINREIAERMARLQICVGCHGRLGVDLFQNIGRVKRCSNTVSTDRAV